eukprot:SAG11_NODE_8067_length_1063_cov_1.808091_1_plen_239_part_10
MFAAGGVPPNHALWLVPTQPSLDAAIAHAPRGVLATLVAELAQVGDWGGRLHVTLTSFAGSHSQGPDHFGKVHGCSLVKLAKHAAAAGGAGGGAWRGREWKARAPEGCTAMVDLGADATLQQLAAALQRRAPCNPRPVEKLHATFRSRSKMQDLRLCAPELAAALRALEWEVAVVTDHQPSDHPRHRHIHIKRSERFLLRAAAGHGGGGGGGGDGGDGGDGGHGGDGGDGGHGGDGGVA